MKNITNHIARRAAILAIVACCAAIPTTAQPPIRIEVLSGLSFGAFFRLGEATVNYYSINAASFDVRGGKGEDLKLMVEGTGLVQVDCSSSRGLMEFEVLPELCAYSIDDGLTWTQFDPRLQWQEVRLPSDHGQGHGLDHANVLVRVGGRARASADQHRGDYTGTITLTAIYK